jgi:Mrp family chromosome partitioning ATPase
MRHNGRSLVAEGFRSLRASILLNASYRPLRVLVVTSAGPGEGKTFVASNLAIALAQAGQRVLLVDGDLRRPSLHRVFAVTNDVGFVDALRQMADRIGRAAAGPPPLASARRGAGSDLLGILASNVENLWLLPAGNPPQNPAELLSAGALGPLVEELKQHWDIVVFDTAPVGGVADALLLGQHASGCLVVARSGSTRRAALGGAMAALRSIGRPMVGVVLNGDRPGPLARFSRDGYYQHGYWSELPSKEPEGGLDAWSAGLGVRAPRSPLDATGVNQPRGRTN